MEIIITQDVSDSLPWLIENDDHIALSWIERCIENKEYFIAKCNGDNVGFLRYSWFWGKIPYMDMIKVLEDKRCMGIGSLLFEKWQTAMGAEGATILMTSSMSDEPEPQAWHRRNGFEPSGQLTFGPLQETPEIFFVKAIGGSIE